MRTMLALVAALLAASCGGTETVGAADAGAGCTKDTDCKGDRICEDGRCIEPLADPPVGDAGCSPEPDHAFCQRLLHACGALSGVDNCGGLRTVESCGTCARCLPGGFCPAKGDADGDGWLDPDDNCPLEPNRDQADADGDGVGDVCDNCPEDSNSDQATYGGCALLRGAACCPDADADGIPNSEDNCPFVANPGQEPICG